MAQTIEINLSDKTCPGGLRYAAKPAALLPKDALICCEGVCLKGEKARRAAKLIAHSLVPDRAVRIATGDCWRPVEA